MASITSATEAITLIVLPQPKAKPYPESCAVFHSTSIRNYHTHSSPVLSGSPEKGGGNSATPTSASPYNTSGGAAADATSLVEHVNHPCDPLFTTRAQSDEEPVFAPEFSKMEFGSAFLSLQSQRNLSKETAIRIV
ncbi:UNVERIFIED_CONTAM: hypothetical protein K2H54_038514 [Gekko kuhli]